MAHQFQEHTQRQTEIQALREERDAANKKVDRYVHLVASLSEELDNLRRGICHNCKKKFVPSYAPIPSSSDRASPRPSPEHRIVSGQQTRTPLSGPAVLPKNAERSPNTCSRIRPISPQQNHTNSAPPQASSAIPRQLPTTPAVQSKLPRWSVSHNPEIKQALHVDLVKTFKFTAMVTCVKFSPDGKYLAVGLGSTSGRTYIYDLEKGLKISCLVDLYLKHQQTVWCIQFSPDNKYIATASDQRIRIWEIARKRTQAAFPADSFSLCFSPNGRFLVARKGRSAHIFSLRDGSSKKLLHNFSNTFSITFSPDGRHIACVDFYTRLKIWDARSGQLLDKWHGESQAGLCVAFSPDGRGLVSGGGDGILRYWDVSSLARGRDEVIGRTPEQRFQQIRKFEGHTSWIRAVSLSSDYQWVATSSDDKSVRIWNPHNAEWQCTLHGHGAYPARTVDFSPAGKYLASGGEDRQVRLWEYRGI